jgi:diguanylate cyclase (GGDEF)-like protein
VISIKKYIELDHQALLEATKAAFLSALEAISESSLLACPPAGAKLQGELEEAESRLRQEHSPDDLVKLGEGVQGSIRAWGNASDQYLQQKAGEVKEIMLVIAQTAESMVSRDQRYAGQLNQLTVQLQSIARLQDLTEIRGRLIRGATELRSCVSQMNRDNRKAIQALKQELTVIQTRVADAERLALTDPLTGLSNRRGVESELDRRLVSGKTFCILFFDLNGFKGINDCHGHLAGDEVLKAFGGELRSAFRGSDVVGRWGGDEFVAVVDGVRAEVEACLGRVREWVFGDYPITLPDSGTSLKIHVQASIGVTESQAGEAKEQLLGRADAAMYEQKQLRPVA